MKESEAMPSLFLTKKFKRRLIVCLIGMIVLIVSITALIMHTESGYIDYKGKQISIHGETIQDHKAFASALGFTLSKNPTAIQKVRIPENFSSIYNEYNEEQKSMGFDLTPYKGKKCTLYTYRAESAGAEDDTYFELLINSGRIIGAGTVPTMKE